MRFAKFIAFFFISIFLVSIIIPSSVAQSEDGYNIIDDMILWFYRWSNKPGPIMEITKGKVRGLKDTIFNENVVDWKVGARFGIPEMFYPDPKEIDIRYLNQTKIVLKMNVQEEDQGGGEKPVNPWIVGMDYEFSLDFPDYIPENAFIYNFDPPFIREGEPRITNLTITPNLPLEAYPGDLIIVINATKYVTYQNFILTTKSILIMRYEWAQKYIGKRLPDRPAYANILVKVDRFHLAEIRPPAAIEAKSDDIVTVPIEIRNFGSHIDTFNFRAYTDPDSGLIVSPPPAVTLKPREAVQTKFSVATPRNFQDPGTAHSIEIEAYSIYDTETTFKNTVTIITRGVYISDISAIYSAFLGLLIILGAVFLFYQRKRILSKYCIKPEKPWNLPEEKKYLEKLKEKDKDEYNKVFKMMEEEYTSSLLWYKYYVMSIKEKKIPKIKVIYLIRKALSIFVSLIKKFISKFRLPKRSIIKKPSKKKLLFKEKKIVKAKKVKVLEAHEKKNLRQLIKNFSSYFKLPEKKVKEIKKVEEVKPIEIKKVEKREISVVDRRTDLEKRRKEQLLVKIRREQEKQRRKFEELSY